MCVYAKYSVPSGLMKRWTHPQEELLLLYLNSRLSCSVEVRVMTKYGAAVSASVLGCWMVESIERPGLGSSVASVHKL